LLLAESKEGAHILKRVKDADDGMVSFQTMEKGSDGILLETNDLNEICKLDNAFVQNETVKFEMHGAVVTKIEHAGMGDRVCIDTTSELFQDEGMILGSTSSGGLVVCSETHYLPYMDLRPFRVNAGGLHLYTWGVNKRTHYLSDLKANDRILIVNSKGIARKVTIGRLKIERRPLLYIEALIENSKINTFIQDDWHVRVMGINGEIRPSSEVKAGDKLLGMIDSPGRHVGIKISETIKEV
jgi:3-amino-4-hydroxybenzoic acid synthase